MVESGLKKKIKLLFKYKYIYMNIYIYTYKHLNVEEQHGNSFFGLLAEHMLTQRLCLYFQHLHTVTSHIKMSHCRILAQQNYNFLSIHPGAQETAIGFPFKKTSAIGSNSAEYFPGHQVVGKHSASSQLCLNISQQCLYFLLRFYSQKLLFCHDSHLT